MQTTLQPTGYVDSQYLNIADAFVRPIKQRSYELMRVRPGQTVLDLGCGVGLDTMALAEQVGPEGHVIGLDRDPDMVAEAGRKARQSSLGGRVGHQLGEASALPFPADYFDACRAERLLMHMADPAAVLAELRRVLKPGGWLVLVEPDWGTLSIATEKVDLERRLARIRAEQFLPNGYAGRLLYPLMRQANFQDMAVEITPVWSNDLSQVAYFTVLEQVEAFAIAKNLATQEELDDWRSELCRAHEGGYFYASLNLTMVAARK